MQLKLNYKIVRTTYIYMSKKFANLISLFELVFFYLSPMNNKAYFYFENPLRYH